MATPPSAADPGSTPGFGVAGLSRSVGGVPRVLKLPGRASVPLDPVGVAGDGGIDIPDDPSRAGWWAAGSAPGDPLGSTVLVGHLDSATHGLGAFAALLDISLGDEVSILDSTGAVFQYVVTGREQITKAALPPSLFTMRGTARLVLITCGGRFDLATHHYEDNVIVTAQPRVTS